MPSQPKVLLIITQDTKEEEGRFIRGQIEAAGCEVVHLDPSIRRDVGGAEIGPEAIAAATGRTMDEVRALGHEGDCLAVMIEGSTKLAVEAHARDGFSGVLAVGGSMGTSLAGAVLQALPIGLPKLIVSTMASGFTTPYVGCRDIAMLNAVTDIAGLNSISREVFRNAAWGIAGMAKGYEPAGAAEKPLVLVGTLGTTETATRRIRAKLEEDGYEVMVFHTSGAGGPSMDAIAAERDVAAVLDLSWTEIVDTLFGGLLASGPDRARAALARGIPVIFAPGNIDFIVGGPLADSEKQFPGKRYHVHNPALTAVRTELPELRRIADHMAGLAREAKGPVRFFVPLGGFSSHDSPEGHLYDTSMPGPFADYLRSVLPAGVPVDVLDRHFNDPEFADAIVEAVREITRERVPA
ncbi:MAG TPA: Tm-1-like ATP-binding domain-containing protein [Sphingomonadaceae bacterium]|nr:Tm-1-like ATP-binding domain-containing protein [Sphingomonadaceae bacterium]